VSLAKESILTGMPAAILNEERYRALIESISAFTWVADASGQFVVPQPGWEQYTGHDFSRHGGSRWIEDVHPEDRARVAEVWKKAVRDKCWYEVKWRCWHAATERWRHCVTRGVPLLDPDGGIREWIGAVTDIEHRLPPQPAEPEWLQVAQSAAGLAFWEWNLETGESRWTPELSQLYGVRPGSPRFKFDDRIHPEDKERVMAAREAAAQAGVYDVTFRIIRPTGELRWLHSKGAKLPNEPKLVGVVSDITRDVELQERYRAQAHELETLIDAIPVRLWVARDAECRVVAGNRSAMELFGLQPGANHSATPGDGSPAPAVSFQTPEGAPIAPEDLPMQRVCRTGEPAIRERINFVMPDGVILTLLTNTVPLFDSAGKVCGGLSAALDISELEGIRKELEHSNRELIFANEQLSQFNFAASHDLREPLRQVSLFSELLEKKLEGRLDPETKQYLGFCREGALRIERLVRDMMAYAAAARLHHDDTQPAATREAFESACRNLAQTIDQAGATVEAGDLPAVRAPRAAVLQVFQNLLSNAIKYRSDAPPHIRVSAVREDAFWRFAVADNGIGIDPQYHELVFGAFKRLHTRARYDGTGIGLAICKQIVERHGGRIWVESQAGQGSTFYFTLRAV
jgi:PAS domain S-box-containing protein